MITKRECTASRVDRRSFVSTLAVSGAAAPALLAQQAQQPPGPPAGPPPRRVLPPEVMPFHDLGVFRRKDVPLKVQPFPMTQVRLNDGPFRDAQETNRKLLLRLSADRLLHNFRVNAGLPSSAKPLGGWELELLNVPHVLSELRGHYTGHFLSACALMYSSTGDKELKAKGDYMVAELAKCQEKLGGGYLSAFPREFWERLDKGERVHVPFYTIHKIMAGMLDMYQHCDNKQALDVLKGMSNWADEWTARHSEEHMQEILRVEYGGMAETLYNLAAITGEDRYARAGDRFNKKVFLNPLGMRRDQLRGMHANTHIPQVIAAARRYEISSDLRFRNAATFFWDTVVAGHTYVTAGTSNSESWRAEPYRLAAELSMSGYSQECCCAYNMLKLSRKLYSWTGNPRYFDYYERCLLNHRLGTIEPETGATVYFFSLTPGAWKTFNTEYDSFWCCTGTGIEEFSKLNDSIYFHDAHGIYVNLFIASELNWSEKGFRLRQETKFPQTSGTALVVTADKPVTMAIRIRVPEWLEGGSVRLNGRALETLANPGGYFSIARAWRTGDRVEIDLPMSLRIEKMPDDPTMQAILYGPLVLAGELGAEGLSKDMIFLDRPAGHRLPLEKAPQIEIPSFKSSDGDPNSWIKPVAGKPLAFRTSGQVRDVSMVPINSIFRQRYSVYWKVL
jgi:DUF1680 family protein